MANSINHDDEPNKRNEHLYQGAGARPSLGVSRAPDWQFVRSNVPQNLIAVMSEPNNRNDTLEANLITVMASKCEPNSRNEKKCLWKTSEPNETVMDKGNPLRLLGALVQIV